MLDIINLDFDYQEQSLLKNISFHLPAAGLLHLRGANGTGKTTLLKLIADLYQPAQGQINFLGKNTQTHRDWYHQQICYVGHKIGINPYLTIQENIFFDVHCALTLEKIQQLAKIFNLQDHLHIPSGLLSAGQRRQVSLLRLWLTKAKLWLLDEPLVALDQSALATIMAKIEDHRKTGGAVLLTSHQNLPLIAGSYEEYCL